MSESQNVATTMAREGQLGVRGEDLYRILIYWLSFWSFSVMLFNVMHRLARLAQWQFYGLKMDGWGTTIFNGIIARRDPEKTHNLMSRKGWWRRKDSRSRIKMLRIPRIFINPKPLNVSHIPPINKSSHNATIRSPQVKHKITLCEILR